MREFELVFYRKENGDCPAGAFISSLNKVMRNKMMRAMDNLELYGNRSKGDFSKAVEDGIFEVRAQTKTDITRILFFFDDNRQIVMLNGFVKKTQKMPASELDTARKYRADYLNRVKAKASATRDPNRQEYATVGPQWRPRLDDIVNETEGKKKMGGKDNRSSKKKDSFGKER